ncbi:hypothetical protein LE181_21030 [Streptomyces sp. SCA3-4]|uniref:hypothetical protein n=1 Tax=Streptomyces sichuanensis TaxID=2871810 RepID=UPI001CE34E3B|nr:hypothetical protein [Streptomyces sichuanensis]MCA6094643.1 hypothetical protein [Streptomyces sichuanensis]
MHRRTAPRLARILACAAVPVMLVATGCSSDGDSGSKKESAKPTKAATPTAAPSAKAAKYAKLPEVCKTVDEKTIEKLVPKAEKKEGRAVSTGNTNDLASCFWSGLNDADVKDLQFRSLTVSLKRLEADPTQGSAEKRAEGFAEQQVNKATTEGGAKDAKTEKVDGIGDSASLVSTETKKDDNDYKNQTVVARTANVVVTVKYSGAGFEGAKSPNVDDMKSGAQDVAKEVVGAVAKANQ